MIIVDDVMKVIDHIDKIQDPALRSREMSVAIVTAICASIYYIVLGTVAIVLGRRLINATLKAWRESRRDVS
jgi:hypothetical protein